MREFILLSTLFLLGQVPVNPPVKVDDRPVSSYTRTAALAVQYDAPFVVFVHCNPKPVSGAYTVYVERMEGYSKGDVVVSVPDSGWLYWKATLTATATEADILKEVSRKAEPFRPVLAVQQTRSSSYCPT